MLKSFAFGVGVGVGIGVGVVGSCTILTYVLSEEAKRRAVEDGMAAVEGTAARVTRRAAK